MRVELGGAAWGVSRLRSIEGRPWARLWREEAAEKDSKAWRKAVEALLHCLRLWDLEARGLYRGVLRLWVAHRQVLVVPRMARGMDAVDELGRRQGGN